MAGQSSWWCTFTLTTLMTTAWLNASADALSALRALEGKKVLVTGSSGGLGAGIAHHLAVDCGARVLVHYHTRRAGAEATQRSILNGGGRCDGLIRCDFRSPSGIDSMWSYIDKIWEGEIDVLVNNAGIVTKAAAEDDVDMVLWHECMQVNLHAPMQLSVAAHKRMKRQAQGGIVCMISSIHGSGSVEWMTAYAASKAALDRLTAGLAAEWGVDGVRVVGVAPGVVPVERTAAVLEKPEAQALWRPHLPVGRMGTAADVAAAVSFVLTNSWTTGSVVTVDGGMMARANMPLRPRPTITAAATTAATAVYSEAAFEPPLSTERFTLDNAPLEAAVTGGMSDAAVQSISKRASAVDSHFSTEESTKHDNDQDEGWMDDMSIVMGIM